MKTLTRAYEPATDLVGDPRWELVQRIVASPLFAKAERLSSFLIFVCGMSLDGRDDEISEQTIGEYVFERAVDYDPTIDGIVRSHALRLRQRLEQFFALPQEADSPMLLTMPRGAYIPVFSMREAVDTTAQSLVESEIPLAGVPFPTLDATVQHDVPSAIAELPAVRRPLEPTTIAFFGVAVLSLLWAAICIGYLMTHAEAYRSIRNVVFETRHPLWGRMFRRDQPTLIVVADSGLVMLQNLTNNRITLPEYVSGEYRREPSSGAKLPPDILEDIGSRRYTSFVDVQTITRLLGIAGTANDHVQVRYARDLRADDLKSGNTILIGSYESTPWIQMYEPRMNFYFVNDLKSGIFSIINRSPQGQEQTTYDYDCRDKEHKVYGLIAFQPALGGAGDTLILEGQTMAGTQAATDFALTDSYLLPFLAKIRQSDGTIPHFEMLVGSKSLAGEASRLELLAYRVEH